MSKTFVYWLRHKDHVNPLKEGYIGITSNMRRRKLEHFRHYRSDVQNFHVYNAMRKYGLDNILMDVLCVCCSRDVAGDVEKAFRPESNIGWNAAAGGAEVFEDRGVEITLYHKDNPDLLVTYPSITLAEESLGYAPGRLKQQKHRDIPAYNTDGWAILLEEDFDRSKTLTLDDRKEAAREAIKRAQTGRTSCFKGMTDRWTEEQKAAIGKAHKGKKLSPEHIERLREVNRHSPKCKEITLQRGEVTRTFHSISEAARVLEIPLTRLKSRVLRHPAGGGTDGWKIVKLGAK